MLADILKRRTKHFVLWRPGYTDPKPTLFIGNFQQAGLDNFEHFKEYPLSQSSLSADLWEIAAADCALTDGQVYFYWFKVRDTSSDSYQTLYATDPMAWAVDRNAVAPSPAEPSGVASCSPASVVLFRDGVLQPADPHPQVLQDEGNVYFQSIAANNRIVIYELPPRWVRQGVGTGQDVGKIVGVGTFRDVLALLTDKSAPNFRDLVAVNERKHILDLGVNVLELLPVADSPQVLEWGYGTSNYLAADFDYGRPEGQWSSTATHDLQLLIQTCHKNGIRFFADVVMAFTDDNSYRLINFSDFLVKPGDEQQYLTHDFNPDGTRKLRNRYGGDSIRFRGAVQGYDPIQGNSALFVPSWQFLKTFICHWMNFYHIDGVRVDDVYDIDNWDFNRDFTNYCHAFWKEDRQGKDEQFLVVGEQLSVPTELVKGGYVDALWNEKFKLVLRSVILGNPACVIGESSFEWSVRKLIDCRNLGFTQGVQAVNYIGSHDVGGFFLGEKLSNERFFNFLQDNNIVYKADYFKLAFVCLLTAVGIPMIFAGDEFANEQHLVLSDHNKQIDPINFELMNDDWRKDLFNYVARLIQFRKTSDALAVDDTNFIHVDMDNKKVVVWQRGQGEHLVIVVANFSSYGSPGGVDGEYIVPNWPYRNRTWQEISQSDKPRVVDSVKVGKEPVFPWQAKVYALVS